MTSPKDSAPGIGDEPQRFLASEVEVEAAFITLDDRRWPLLRFTFTHMDDSVHVDVVLESSGMRTLRQLISFAIDKAITKARRGR